MISSVYTYSASSCLSERQRFRQDALMGARGPLPRSGVRFDGREVVLRGTAPTVYVEPGEPARAIADRRGYASIHRLVASRAFGRWVTRGEAVTPIDGDPWNWAPTNLQIRPLAASLPPARRGSRRPGRAARQPRTGPPKAAGVSRSASRPKK